jgi:hypothetical protein
MAGVKITDLTPLATAASDDLLYIVDISDTTESPQGTSKSIEVGNLLPTIPILSSGTWTPTLSDFTGCVVDATLVYAFYSQIDNIVTCTIHASVDLNFSLGGGSGYLEFTKPIATSTFTPIGVGQLHQDSTNCNISSNSSKMYFYSTSSANIGVTSFSFSFQYEIV